MLLRLTFLETRPDLFLGHFSKHHYLKLRLKLLYIEQLVNWQHTGVPQVSSPAGHMTRVGRNGLISESTCVNTVKDTFVIQMDKQSSIGHAASPGAWYSHTGSCYQFNVYTWTWEDVISLPRSPSDVSCAYGSLSILHRVITASPLPHIFRELYFMGRLGWDGVASQCSPGTMRRGETVLQSTQHALLLPILSRDTPGVLLHHETHAKDCSNYLEHRRRTSKTEEGSRF